MVVAERRAAVIRRVADLAIRRARGVEGGRSKRRRSGEGGSKRRRRRGVRFLFFDRWKVVCKGEVASAA
jgi:hypothetical protein